MDRFYFEVSLRKSIKNHTFKVRPYQWSKLKLDSIVENQILDATTDTQDNPAALCGLLNSFLSQICQITAELTTSQPPVSVSDVVQEEVDLAGGVSEEDVEPAGDAKEDTNNSPELVESDKDDSEASIEQAKADKENAKTYTEPEQAEENNEGGMDNVDISPEQTEDEVENSDISIEKEEADIMIAEAVEDDMKNVDTYPQEVETDMKDVDISSEEEATVEASDLEVMGEGITPQRLTSRIDPLTDSLQPQPSISFIPVEREMGIYVYSHRNQPLNSVYDNHSLL